MDVNEIGTLISTLGFPIAACIYMAKVNADMGRSHREEMSKVTEALNELKLVITQLTDKIN